MEEVAEHRYIDTIIVRQQICSLKNVGKTYWHKGSVWREKLKCPRRSLAGKNTLKELWKIFWKHKGQNAESWYKLRKEYDMDKMLTLCDVLH